MKLKTLRMVATLATVGACSQAALAEGGPEINFSGFGTLGFVSTNSDTAAFRNGIRQDQGATESDTDLGVDSRVGLQANVKFNDTFSAVGQVLAMRRDGEFAPSLEWLYGQAKVADWADVRLGRMVLPVFMMSDSRNVGYASHWLRAPQEVYAYYPPTSFDGVQGVFRHNMADTNFTLQVSAGTSKADVSFNPGYQNPLTNAVLNGVLEYNKLYSFNLVAEHGNWTGRFGYTVGSDTEVSLGGATVEAGKDKFTGLGLQYDNGSLLVLTEYVTRRWTTDLPTGNDAFFDGDAYSISAGYRFGSVMPYVTTSTFKPKANALFFDKTPGNTRTNAIGVRWDFMKNVAFKAQVEETKGTILGHILPIDPTFNPRDKVRAISVAMDFVF